jgi:hypothetical protein
MFAQILVNGSVLSGGCALVAVGLTLIEGCLSRHGVQTAPFLSGLGSLEWTIETPV